MKRIIFSAGLSLLAVACGPTDTETNLECGAGVEANVEQASYCVYKQELIIEGFECPQGLNRHDLEGGNLTLCGESPMMPPLGHIEEIKMKYGNPAQCLEAPTCTSEQVEIDKTSCQVAGAACAETSTCGNTIGCLDVPQTCDQAVGTPAACPGGTTEVASCTDAASCQIVWGTDDQCGTYKFCEGEVVACRAIPTCGENQVEIDRASCQAAGAACTEETECDTTIGCLDVPQTCDQNVGTPATCPAGTAEVTACTDASCQLVRGDGDQCGTYKFCQDDAAAAMCGTIAGLTCAADESCVDIPNDGCDLTSGGGADCAGTCQSDANALNGFLTESCGPVDNQNVRLRVYADLAPPSDCSFPNTLPLHEIALDVGSIADITMGVDYVGDPNDMQVTECTGAGACQSIGTYSIFFDQVGPVLRGIYKITDGQGVETTGSVLVRGCGGNRPACG